VSNDERIITCRYASRCRLCGRHIAAGEQAHWTRGLGVRCSDGGTGEAVCVDIDHDPLLDAPPRDWGDL